MAKRKRDIQLKFRVTPQEREMIETKMAQFGTTNMAAYLRKIRRERLPVHHVEVGRRAECNDFRHLCSPLSVVALSYHLLPRPVNTFRGCLFLYPVLC